MASGEGDGLTSREGSPLGAGGEPAGTGRAGCPDVCEGVEPGVRTGTGDVPSTVTVLVRRSPVTSPAITESGALVGDTCGAPDSRRRSPEEDPDDVTRDDVVTVPEAVVGLVIVAEGFTGFLGRSDRGGDAEGRRLSVSASRRGASFLDR